MDALKRAIKAAGGQVQLAEAIEVAKSAPAMWLHRGNVPAEHCPRIEKATGVRCEDLRPDVWWHVVRGVKRPAKRRT